MWLSRVVRQAPPGFEPLARRHHRADTNARATEKDCFLTSVLVWTASVDEACDGTTESAERAPGDGTPRACCKAELSKGESKLPVLFQSRVLNIDSACVSADEWTASSSASAEM